MLHYQRRTAAAALSVMIVLALAPPLASAEPAGPWLSRLQEATGDLLEGWRGWWLPEVPEDAVRSEDIGTDKEGCGMDPNGTSSCLKKRDQNRASVRNLRRELDLKK